MWPQHSMRAQVGINNKITVGLEYWQAVTSRHQPTSFLSYLPDLRGVSGYHLQYCPWIIYDMPPPLRANQCRWSFCLCILSLAIIPNSTDILKVQCVIQTEPISLCKNCFNRIKCPTCTSFKYSQLQQSCHT